MRRVLLITLLALLSACSPSRVPNPTGGGGGGRTPVPTASRPPAWAVPQPTATPPRRLITPLPRPRP